jgi:hypothetical protein
VRYQFVEILVHLAKERYAVPFKTNPKAKLTIADAVELMIKDNLQPFFARDGMSA